MDESWVGRKQGKALEVGRRMEVRGGFLPRHDEDLREPLVRRQGSQVSMCVARGERVLALESREGTRASRRVEASCGASVGFHTRYDGELREPLVWHQGSQVSMLP